MKQQGRRGRGGRKNKQNCYEGLLHDASLANDNVRIHLMLIWRFSEKYTFFFFFFIKKGILCCRVITSAKQMYGIVPLQFLFWLPSMQLSKQGYRPLTAEDVILFINCKAPGYRNATQTCYDASHINNWSFYSSTQLLEEHATHRRSGIYWYLVQYVGNPIEARKAVPMIPFFTPYLVRP